MDSVVRAAVHRILPAAGCVSGIAIGILALRPMARVAAFGAAGTSIAAISLNMRAVRGPAATPIIDFVGLLSGGGAIARGQRPSPPRAAVR